MTGAARDHMNRERWGGDDAHVVGFVEVPAEIAAYCLRMGRAMSATRGLTLTRIGDAASRCFYVRRGYAKVHSQSPAGHQVLVGFAGPSDLIGQSAGAEWGRRYLATTTASGPMELVWWTRKVALELSARFPEVHAHLDALLAQNLQLVLNRLHALSEGGAMHRLASVLLELGGRHGDRLGTSIQIRPTVTRADLAELTGMTLHNASRVLSSWSAAGVIDGRRGRIRLKQVDRLRAIATDLK
jgi:CRP-like cAMP-binding protein